MGREKGGCFGGEEDDCLLVAALVVVLVLLVEVVMASFSFEAAACSLDAQKSWK